MSTKTKKEFKKADPLFNPADLYQSPLEVPEGLKKEIDGKGLAFRWINATEFQRQYGFHRSGWKPYKPDVKVSGMSELGGDAEGFVRRGDLILATKTKAENEKHKLGLKMKADRALGYNKIKAEELRKDMLAAGIASTVVEGYEDKNETEEDND